MDRPVRFSKRLLCVAPAAIAAALSQPPVTIHSPTTVSGLASETAPVAPFFAGLGVLPGTGGNKAHAISADGSTVVGDSQLAGATRAFLWTAQDGLSDLGPLPTGGSTTATGVSGDGQVAVGTLTRGHSFGAFRWSRGGGMHGIGVLPGSTDSAGWAISADGATITGTCTTLSGFPTAFYWRHQTGIVELAHLPNTVYSEGRGVSGDGTEIVGFDWADGPSIAFDASAAGIVGLNDPHCIPFICLGPAASALAISEDGSMIVGFLNAMETDPWFEAFRWTSQGGMVRLGWLPSFPYQFSEALAVSGDGSVVVGVSGSAAFIWDAAHGMRDLQRVLSAEAHLDLHGWQLLQATGVSSDGSTIVGYGINRNSVPNWRIESWIAHL